MATTRLYIARHGNTFDAGETVLRVGARTDLALSTSGQKQAAGLGAHFAQQSAQFNTILTSPLKRARQTADAVAAATRFDDPLQMLPMLTEIDYGPDEGQPEATVVARLGQDALNRWDSDAIPPDGWRVDPPALIGRWEMLFSKLAKGSYGETVLAVTSNGIARFALDAANKVPSDTPRKLRTGAFGVVHIGGDGVEVVEWDVRPR